MAKSIIEYPAWHDRARELRKSGKQTKEIAEMMGVSRSRISAITADGWKQYLVMFSRANKTGIRKIKSVSTDAEVYEFVAIPGPSPAEREAARAKEKSSEKRYVPMQGSEPMAREREFEVSKKLHEGKMLVGALIKCSSCDATAEYFNYKGSVTPSHLPKEFTRMGWLVAKSPRADKCPTCLAKLKGKPIESAKQAAEVISNAIEILPVFKTEEAPAMSYPPAVTKAPEKAAPLSFMPPPTTTQKPPFVSHITTDDGPAQPVIKEMTRTDRRIIFAKLDEVYIDEKEGYRDDWDDEKVSQDLGVPLSWVSQVRSADFGPEISAKSRMKEINNLNTLVGANNRLIVLIDKKLEQMQALDAKLKTALEEIDAAINRAEELSKNIETEDKHMEALLASFDAQAAEFKKKYAEFAERSSAQ